jgi:uncharacterized membrane protein YozB (DUF420 family)
MLRAPSKPEPAGKVLCDYFYAWMSLLIAAVVVFGFAHTIDAGLLHARNPRPAVVYLHAIVFSAFVALFVVQSALIRAGDIRWHRRLGWLGVAMGAAMPVLGLAAALSRPSDSNDAASLGLLLFQLNDILDFSIAYGLAVWWRGEPEFHRRLMLLAACFLTSAAFGRFPAELLPDNPLWFYAGVDMLILLGVARDLWVLKRVHPVYSFGVLTLFRTAAPACMAGVSGLIQWSG